MFSQWAAAPSLDSSHTKLDTLQKRVAKILGYLIPVPLLHRKQAVSVETEQPRGPELSQPIQRQGVSPSFYYLVQGAYGSHTCLDTTQ